MEKKKKTVAYQFEEPGKSLPHSTGTKKKQKKKFHSKSWTLKKCT